MIGSILPIILLLFIVGIIFSIASRSEKPRPIIKFNKNIIIVTYAVLLIISTVTYPIVTKNLQTIDLEVYGEEMGGYSIERSYPTNLDELEKTFEKTISYDFNSIYINPRVDHFTSIYYKKTDELSDQIIVSYYTEEQDWVQNYTSYSSSPEVWLSRQDLFLEDEYIEISFSVFTKEFIITHFKDEPRWISGSKLVNEIESNRAYLIQVPEHVEIKTDDEYIELFELK